MTTYEKESILSALGIMEKRIHNMKETITSITNDARYGESVGENIATYATRLNGHMQERRGFCSALNILGLHVEWDGEHAIDIKEE